MRARKGMKTGVLLALAALATALPADLGAVQAREMERAEEAMRRARMEMGMGMDLRRAELEMARATREMRVREFRLEASMARAAREAAVRDLRRSARTDRLEVPAPWIVQDPADSLYRAARAALNEGAWERAASLFAEIRAEHPRSGYVADSYYFQALALQRAGGSRSMRRALELLEEQARSHRNAATSAEARALRVRLEGSLARGGDPDAAARIQERASAGCESDEQELRSSALSALLQMDADRAVPILREVLKSRDECSAELRKRAVFLVSQKMTPETVDVLLDLAHRNPDPDPEVREAAVFWLSQVRSEEAVGALEAILRGSTDPTLQEKAIFAISQHPSERATGVIRSYAERADAPRDLREKAIFWIGQRRGEENKAFLRQLYGRLQDQELKEKVIFGVAQSATEEDRRWLIELAKDRGEPLAVRKNALFWAGQSGRIGAGDLRELYNTLPDREMKEQVVFTLSQQKGPDAVTALMGIAESEEDAKLRQRAVFWLGQSDDPRVAEFLLRIIKGGG